jgi:hypothetical protein
LRELTNVGTQSFIRPISENEIVDESGKSVGRILAASKPNRNALDLTETFNPFEDVEKEISEAILEIGNTYQEFVRFDRTLLLHVNQVWIRFSQRTLDIRDRGIDLTRARLQFPGLRIGEYVWEIQKDPDHSS